MMPLRLVHLVPNPWTEAVVEDTIRATVAPLGRVLAVRVPEDWPAGTPVRLLRLPKVRP